MRVRCAKDHVQHQYALHGWADAALSAQIHAGGSAVVSDLQGAAQAFLEWIGKSLDVKAL